MLRIFYFIFLLVECFQRNFADVANGNINNIFTLNTFNAMDTNYNTFYLSTFHIYCNSHLHENATSRQDI